VWMLELKMRFSSDWMWLDLLMGCFGLFTFCGWNIQNKVYPFVFFFPRVWPQGLYLEPLH
jgi:hypothetical protein